MSKVMLIRYDGKPARLFADKNGNLVPCFPDTEGFPVYIMEIDLAKGLALGNPERYRYYRSPTIDIQVPTPSGAIKWEKLHSWKYDKITVQVGNDDNEEAIYETRINWALDEKDEFVIEASEEFITGKKKFDDRSKEMALLTGENKQLTGVLQSQAKLIEELKAEVKTLRNKVDSLEQGKRPKGRPVEKN